jgi:lauroyl/myristoyl acyltransferase
MSISQAIHREPVQVRGLEARRASRDALYTGTARAWADFWISRVMVPSAERWPGFVSRMKPVFVEMAWRTSGYLRGSLVANARRILGDQAGSAAHARLGRAVLSNFYDFICEIAGGEAAAGASRFDEDKLEGRDGEIIGRERYLATRALKRGAILVTAHLGAFESAVAALRRDEPHVHIVFRRDPMKRFERLRAAQRQRLGVIEAAVDDGLGVWMNLRDALLNDHVVLMQGDRVMPSQNGVSIPFFDGHMLFPTGPVKLAMMTGSPLVPIFAPRGPDGRVQIIIETPVSIIASDDRARDVEHALIQLAAMIENSVRAYPDQWLVLQRAFCEDQTSES